PLLSTSPATAVPSALSLHDALPISCCDGHGRPSTLTPAPVPGTVLVASASACTANETASRRTGDGQGREMGAGLAFPRLALSRPDRGVRRIHDLVRSLRNNVGRRQCDRFSSALDDLGLLRQHVLYQLDGLLDLLIAHRLNPSGMLDFHFPRHQERANLHVCHGLLLTHLFNRGRPVLFEVGSEGE